MSGKDKPSPKGGLFSPAWWRRRIQHGIANSLERIDFLGLAERVSKTPAGRPWFEFFAEVKPEVEDRRLLVDRTVANTAAQLSAEGVPFDEKELRAIADNITTTYQVEGHRTAGALVLTLMEHLFEHQPGADLFLSPDRREVAHLDKLKAYKDQGLGVVFLCNHSSHVDEFIVDAVLNHQRVGVPFFAAGTNMMAIRSLARLLMLGSYKVQRSGAGKIQLSTLFNHCRAISELGLMQGIFLEAWRGGARSRDGSLRYPRRLVTLRGAIAGENDVVIQPVAVSYAIVPEDMPLAERKGARSWFRGMGLWRTLFTLLAHPKAGLWRAAENLYGRAYCTLPEPMLLSELKERHAADRGDLELDEFVALSAIREIARTKKVMASQLAARGLVRTRRNGQTDLIAAMETEQALMIEYHHTAFGQDPDFEDFIRDHSSREVLEEGLATLRRRGVIGRWKPRIGRQPKVKAEAALNFYATHGDRRLYSPTAKENLVIVGAGDWGFALTYLIGNRILEEKRYLNASLTLFDPRSELIDELALDRRPPGRFGEVRLPKNVFVTNDPPSAFKKASEVILTSPPARVAEAARQVMEYSEQELNIILAGWGFDPATGKLPYHIVAELAAELGRRDVEIYVFAGPVRDADLVLSREAVGVLAGPKSSLSELADRFDWPPFSLTTSEDPVGVSVAQVMSKVYGLWGGYLMKAGRMKGAARMGLFMTRATAEAMELALALGGRAETFSAASVAWAASMVADGLAGPYMEFGRKLVGQFLPKRDAAAAAAKLAEQMTADGKPVRAYYDLRAAYLAAKRLGLELPMLSEAYQTVWGE